MANVSYDTLTIQINADSKNANATINNLSKNLQKLNNTAKELDKQRVEEVKTLLLDISNIDFSNVSKGLQDVVNAFKSLQKISFTKKVSGNNDGGGLTNAYQSINPPLNQQQPVLPELSGIEQLTHELNLMPKPLTDFNLQIELTNKQLKELGVNAKNLTPLENQLREIGLNADQINRVFNATKKTLSSFTDKQFKEIAKSLEQLGFTGKEAKQIMAQLKNETNGGAFSWQKIIANFKSLLRNRVLRKVIQELYQAMKQGIENVSNFDSATGQSLAKITQSLNFVINAIGSAVAPLIQAFEPIATMLLDLVGELGNTLGQLFGSLNGDEAFVQATKNAEDLNKEIKKGTSLGIDELNVISQDTDQSGNFTYVDRFGNDLGDGLDTSNKKAQGLAGTLSGIAKTLATILKPVMQLVSSLSSVFAFVGDIFTIVSDIYNLVLLPIGEVMMGILQPIIDLIGTSLGSIFRILGLTLRTLLLPIVSLLSVIMIPINGIFTGLMTIVYVLQAIIETLVKLATFQWWGIGKTWQKMGDNIKNAWNNYDKQTRSTLNAVGGAYSNVGQDWSKNFKGYASGGFPEDGFFYANHNELVGQFSNGKTAVANNQEITQGIYQAVLQAIRESNANGDITINLDGYEMAKIITKRQNNFGQTLVRGGNINYGK